MSVLLACQDKFIDKPTLVERVETLARLGFEGAEISGRRLREANRPLDPSSLALPVSAISLGYRGALLSDDNDQRELARSDLLWLLGEASRFGAVGVIAVASRDHHALADLSMSPAARAELVNVLKAELSTLLGELRASDTKLLLEARNRYEAEVLTSVAEVQALAAELGDDRVGLEVDVFHVMVEESDPVELLRRTANAISYVQIADSGRRLPGEGSTDFVAIMSALLRGGYGGYLSIERWDDAAIVPLAALSNSLTYLRGCRAKANLWLPQSPTA